MLLDILTARKNARVAAECARVANVIEIAVSELDHGTLDGDQLNTFLLLHNVRPTTAVLARINDGVWCGSYGW